MRIIRKMDGLKEKAPCALALGAFDGLHIGHRQVISAAVRGEYASAVFTFSGLRPLEGQVLTPSDKEVLLESFGVERLYTPLFSEVQRISPEDFVQGLLFNQCQARQLCCGEDFRFGYKAAGDVSLLSSLCKRAGVELTVVPAVSLGDEKVSSTRIRKAIGEGDVMLAARLLGRPVSFESMVLHGNRLGGPVLHAPTINQALPDGFTAPRFGVYASLVQIEGETYMGVTNVGMKPTVGSKVPLAETWMPEFSGDLYGRVLRISLLHFIRPEKKFESLELLKKEIHKNAEEAHALLKPIAWKPWPENLWDTPEHI